MLQIPSDFEALMQMKAHLFEARRLYWYSTLFSLQWWLNLSANLTSIPITFMLIYQYYPEAKAFLWVTIAISLLFSFVIEPLLVWLGIYRLYHWTYCCSFPIYILLSVAFRLITKRIFAIQSGHGK
ncbi:MAG: hypothetical protein P4N41_05070 [Negativicutes bacterium]|nr:hypothetical protein [Negativicutes bacterium]